MKNVLVTGANGFVGQHVVQHILSRGWTPIALVKDYNRKSNPELSARVQRKGAEIMGDILDRDLIRYIVSKYELDYIIHLAAIPIVKMCDADPWTAYQVNTMGSVILYEAVRDQLQRDKRIQKIIHMSTDKAYGDSSPPGGYTEGTPFVTTDTYCVSKACGDMIARSYAMTYDLPICVVRCGNLYGEGDLNLSRLIPGTILRLLNGQQPVLYSDAAGMKREFIHVSDAVSAYMTLLEHGMSGNAYNIGTGFMYSIREVIDLIREKIDPSIDIRIVDRELFEINEQCLNADRLRGLGWDISMPLDKGLHQAIGWYRWWKGQTE
jgi:CDP-glucose 4,6-dehydratase